MDDYDVDELMRCATAARNVCIQGDRLGFGAAVAWFDWVGPELERMAQRLAAEIGYVDPDLARVIAAEAQP